MEYAIYMADGTPASVIMSPQTYVKELNTWHIITQ